MAKYGKQSERDARRAARKIANAHVPDWAPPEGVRHPAEIQRTSGGSDLFLTLRTVRLAVNNSLVEFAVIVTLEREGASTELWCIDSCNHGSVHRHREGNHRDFEVIRRISSAQDLDQGLRLAIEEGYDFMTEQGGLND